MGTFCGTTVPNVVKSTGNKMFVKFHSDVSVGGKGFSASFKKSKKKVDILIKKNHIIKFLSPNEKSVHMKSSLMTSAPI